MASAGLSLLADAVAAERDGAFGPAAELEPGFGGYRHVGMALFTDYLLAFEATSLLLLAAMVGAVILAKRRID